MLVYQRCIRKSYGKKGDIEQLPKCELVNAGFMTHQQYLPLPKFPTDQPTHQCAPRQVRSAVPTWWIAGVRRRVNEGILGVSPSTTPRGPMVPFGEKTSTIFSGKFFRGDFIFMDGCFFYLGKIDCLQMFQWQSFLTHPVKDHHHHHHHQHHQHHQHL